MNTKPNKILFHYETFWKQALLNVIFFIFFLFLYALSLWVSLFQYLPFTLAPVIFRCIHLIDLLYWGLIYLSILQDILHKFGMTQDIPTCNWLWLQRHVTLFLNYYLFCLISCNLLNMQRRPYPLILARLFWATI